MAKKPTPAATVSTDDATVILTRGFSWSPDGFTIIEFKPGAQQLPERARAVAKQLGIIGG